MTKMKKVLSVILAVMMTLSMFSVAVSAENDAEATVCEHEYGKWIISQDETCTEDGIKYRECTKCDSSVKGHIETGFVKATGHAFDEGVVTAPTCANKGYTLYTCTNCGSTEKKDETTALEHTWGEWAQTLAPTCIADGTEARACSVCSGTEEKAIPALGHDYVATVVEPDYENDGYTVYDCSRCDANYKETDEGSMFKGRVLSVELGEKLVLKYGEIGEVKPVVEIGGTVEYTYEFKSGAENVATVDKDGNITGMGMGKTVITCTVTDQYGNVVTDTVDVQVKFSLGNWFQILREVLKAAIEYVIGGLDFGPIKDLIGGNK